MANLTELQQRIEAVVGQTTTTTEGNDDWNLRRSYLNRAQRDWSERFDWPQLYKEVNSRTSQATGNATIAMPTNFRKLATPLRAAESSNLLTDVPQVDPQEKGRFGTSDKYSYILGDPSNGYNLVTQNVSLGSGASISFSYYQSPNSLVSGNDISLCPNPNYLVQQGLYYYFLANEDNRFQDQRSEAEKILANMLEFENTKGSGYHNEVFNSDETKHGFRWGKS